MASPLPLPLSIIAVSRMAIGVSCFVLPAFTCASFFYPIPPGSNLAIRMVGSRDFFIGALLYAAKSPEARRNAVLIGAAVDALDAAASIFGWAKGEVDGAPTVMFGGGAMSFVLLAALGWRMGGLGKI